MIHQANTVDESNKLQPVLPLRNLNIQQSIKGSHVNFSFNLEIITSSSQKIFNK